MAELIIKLPPDQFVFGEWEIFDEPKIYQEMPEANKEIVLCTRILLSKKYNNKLVWSIHKEPNIPNIPEIRICYTFDDHHYYHSFNIKCLKAKLLTYKHYENLEEMAKQYYPNYYHFDFSNEYYTAVNQPNSLQIAMNKCDDFYNFISNYRAFL